MTARRYLTTVGADCPEDGARPCGRDCRYTLPGLVAEPEEGEEPEPVYHCALDFAADHPDGAPLAAVGAQFGVTRERARQLQNEATARLVAGLRRLGVETSPHWREMLTRAGVEITANDEIEHVAPDKPMALEDVAALPRFARRLAAVRVRGRAA